MRPSAREHFIFVSWLKVLRKWATSIFGALIGVALFYGAWGLLIGLVAISLTCSNIAYWLLTAYFVIVFGYPFITAAITPEAKTAIFGGESPNELTNRELKRWAMIDEVVSGVAFALMAGVPLSGLYALVVGCR